MRQVILFAVVLLQVVSPTEAYDGPRQSTKVPRFDAAVDRGLAYLQAEAGKTAHGGQQILAAYAMLKCGVPKEDAFVARAIAAAVGRSVGGQYQPISAYDHIYGSGVDAMLLTDLDAKDQYLPNLQAIAN